MYKQDNIINKIKSTSLQDFPHTLMLLGERGSGKSYIVDYISKYYNIPYEDISNMISYDKIQEIIGNPLIKFYVIRRSYITTKNENMLLKFLEEPLNNCYIIIMTDTDDLIETVKNRCQIWELEKYDNDYLISLMDDDSDIRLIDIFHTPGDIIKYKNFDLNEVINKVYTIFENIRTANFSNILTIPNWIDFSNSGEGYPFDIFLRVLKYVISNKIMTSRDEIFLHYFYLTEEFANNVSVPISTDKKRLFENYLLKMRFR